MNTAIKYTRTALFNAKIDREYIIDTLQHELENLPLTLTDQQEIDKKSKSITKKISALNKKPLLPAEQASELASAIVKEYEDTMSRNKVLLFPILKDLVNRCNELEAYQKETIRALSFLDIQANGKYSINCKFDSHDFSAIVHAVNLSLLLKE